MQRQKWVTDKINPPKIEKQGIGKDKLMIKLTKVQPFILLDCENSDTITKTHTLIFKPHDTWQTKLNTNSRLNKSLRANRNRREFKTHNPKGTTEMENGKLERRVAMESVKHRKE